MPRPPTATEKALAKFPLKTMVAAILLSYLVVRNPPFSIGFGFGRESMKAAEFYPFSSFPMYSRFSDRPIYVYVSDAEDRPIAALTEFGTLSSELKKHYDARLREVKETTGVNLRAMSPEDKRPAGTATLRHLRDHLAPEAFAPGTPERRLRLHEVTIRFENGRVVTDDVVVGEL